VKSSGDRFLELEIQLLLEGGCCTELSTQPVEDFVAAAFLFTTSATAPINHIASRVSEAEKPIV